jgi:hypothetical protein
MSDLHFTELSRVWRRRDPVRKAASWLRVGPGAAVWFEGDTGLVPDLGPADLQIDDLERGVARWRTAISLRRAAVIVRRALLIAVVCALAVDLIVWAFGGDRRNWWLLLPFLAAAVLVLVELRSRVTVQETARLLDTGLGLQSRVETAVELDSQPRVSGTGAALLAERVNAEAGVEVAQSFKTARLRSFAAPGEWGTLGAALVALFVLVAIHPGSASSRGAGSGLALSHRSGAKGVLLGNGSGRRVKGTAGQRTSPSSTTPRLTSTLPHGTFRNPYGPKLTAAELKAEVKASNKKQGTHDFQVVRSASPGGEAGQRGEAGSKSQSGPPSSRLTIGSKLGASGGGLQNKSAQVPPGAGVQSSHLGGGSSGSGAKRSTSASPSGQTGSGGSQQGGAGHSHPGGEQAGAAPGSSALGAGLTPDVPHGSVGLPIQAGYAPSADKHDAASHGSSQTPNGNGVGGHTAISNNTGAGGTGSGLSVIPPSSDSAPVSQQTQRNNYFGVANQVQLKSW